MNVWLILLGIVVFVGILTIASVTPGLVLILLALFLTYLIMVGYFTK